ncbi:DUF4142 domain-containing protein [Caenimonas aquaedulcis]|uniref:DUF4142 domain-containing protein n=1 Tax=Caenimonas aquaedulcis TaxID=2793270 RepID=A0A931MIU2_9BURK|nr:DUF4142 domain-containing protein [Caenimonas aquaedulcis]MBG9390377.1 DUF4142 domain-containing protein [Caenimonas aquaedulcis]
MTRMRYHRCLIAALWALTVACSAGAQVEAPPAPAKPRAANPAMFAPGGAVAVGDRRMTPQQRDEWRFLKEAAAASRFESDAARLALAKSTNPEVRNFAAALIKHNSAAGNELLHMLQMRGMAAPMLADAQRKMLNRMAKLQGTKFDREFVEAVALRHQQQDVSDFERASMATRDPQIKAWIDQTLPQMRYQLVTGEQLAPNRARVYKISAPLRAAGPG